MAELIGLEGISGGKLEALFIMDVKGIKTIILNGKAAIAAADGGAINIYLDDANEFIHCEAMRNMRSLEKVKLTSWLEVNKWASKWLRKIGFEQVK